MLNPGDVIPYLTICSEEGVILQRGMNYRLRGETSVILMSIRPGAPYADRIEEDGKILIYEGHNIPKKAGGPNPKTEDQPMLNPGGTPTQNGQFCEATRRYKKGEAPPVLVKVYEKIRSGIWVYNGVFKLIDAWQEVSNARKVFKFKLEITDTARLTGIGDRNIDHTRLIPTSVKLEVWKRDKAQCIICGSRVNLHFDHIIPYSKGGSSLVAENIQLLCARHNLQKRDRVE